MRRKFSSVAAVLLAALVAFIGVAAWASLHADKGDGRDNGLSLATSTAERNKRCASQKTFAAIQRELFRQAAETRGSDEAAFGQISNYSFVRMERPVVRSFDEELSTLRCSGKLVLQLPRGTAVVGGRHALTADIDYVLQPAADGSGDVVMLEGEAPITIPLATLARSGSYADLAATGPELEHAQVAAAPGPVAPAQSPLPPTPSRFVPAPSQPPSTRQRAEVVAKPRLAAVKSAPVIGPEPAATTIQAKPTPRHPITGSAKPSFNCRYARTRGEISVCGDARLASMDRKMAASYYGAVASANGNQREALRTSRNAFLRKRDRCSDSACISASYQQRISEIREIMTR